MPGDNRHPHHRVVAVAALLDASDQLLMVRTRRLPSHWQPVGGGQIPQDPTPQVTVAREVREELGLQLRPADFVPALQVPYDFGDGTVHFYTARLPSSARLQVNDGEIVEHRWVSLDTAQHLAAYPATTKFLNHLAAQRAGAQPTPSPGRIGTRRQRTAR